MREPTSDGKSGPRRPDRERSREPRAEFGYTDQPEETSLGGEKDNGEGDWEPSGEEACCEADSGEGGGGKDRDEGRCREIGRGESGAGARAGETEGGDEAEGGREAARLSECVTGPKRARDPDRSAAHGNDGCP
jgi:hypothetical protein